MGNIHIFLVDDHQVVREGLQHMLEQESDMIVIGQGANGQYVLTAVEELSPDIVLMDIKMSGVDGIELTRRIKQKRPFCKVIMLTLYDEYLTEAMEAGAAGYLLKDVTREGLTQSIRRVYHGEIVISDDITKPTVYQKVEPDAETLFQEVQLLIPPTVDDSQLMRLANQVEETLQSRVLQVVGSWQEGTAMNIVLNEALPLQNILDKLGGVHGIEISNEKSLSGTSPSLLKKAAAVPSPKNRPRKTIFASIRNGWTPKETTEVAI